MSRGGGLRWVADHLPGVDETVRADLVDTIERATPQAPVGDRLAEAVSLVGFALQSASRRGTGDHRTQMLRQGARVAALPLAAAFSATAWSGGSLVAALAGAMVVVLVGAGLRKVAAVPGLIAVASAVSSPPQLFALGAVVLVVVLAGEPFDRVVCPTGGLLAGAGVVAGAAVGVVWSPAQLFPVVDVGGLVVLALFLVVGWSDPRFAVAATILCAARFVTADASDLAAALAAAAGRDEVRLVLARWVFMGAGVATCWWVTRAALDRCLTVHR